MSIETDVFEIVSRRLKFELSDLSLETNLRKDLNADSIDSVEVIFELEDLYEIVIEDEVAEDLQTIGSIIDVITQRTNK
ncbi:MAG: acyl carrier protein [Candidatus Endolissoclinum sp.]|nr:acyl carrier protein [Candidatus Endolissoclinum sp.]